MRYQFQNDFEFETTEKTIMRYSARHKSNSKIGV